MKTLTTQILSMALLFVLPTWVSAQVFNGSLTLSTQAQVDAFNYTEVTGSLTIGYWFGGASSDINNLQPLSKLTKVGEDLRINNNSQLQDLQGLGNLTTIGSSFEIVSNVSLTTLQGLDNLSSVGYLTIGNNDILKNLQGLENISSLNSIDIFSNNQLQDLEGLDKVLNNIVNPDQVVLSIGDNPNLTSLNELKNVTAFLSLTIRRNNQLQDLQGLDNLSTITSSLTIEDNASLTTLQGLNNLSSVSHIRIEGNEQLQNLQGLENLTTLDGNLSIENNPKLTSLNELKNITSTSLNELNIINNDQLQDLKGLENLTVIHRVLEIVDNDQLQNLQGLNNLSAIGHKNENDQDGEIGVLDIFVYGLIITDNEQLKNLQGLESLTTIDVTFGNLFIISNPSLTSLQGLENLTKVSDEEIIISNNTSLVSLQGLESLTMINGLAIGGNPKLTSLQGLNNLNSVSFLQISSNNQLHNLQGLENLQSLGGMYITNNPNLNDCCAIANLLSKATGTKIIRDNGSNCNSEEAIQESCPPVITGFTLVNATTDQDISELELTNTPAVINMLETGIHLNIRANAVGQMGSVVFALDGVTINKENVGPYALAGDLPPGDYRSWTPTLGRHTLTATPYEEKNGKGKKGEPLTLEFVVIDQALAIISFTLITTHDDQDQYELKDGSTISLQQYDPDKLNIRANTYPEEVGSVVFDLNTVKNFQTENVFPYALAGDIPPGDYKDYTLPAGIYQLTATPYSRPRRRGEAGMPLTITFEVVEDQMAVARTISATSPKDKAVEDVTVVQNIAQVMVYPNPSEGLLHIKLPDAAQPVALYLYNAQGHQVMETRGSEAGSLILDVSHLAAGMYVLKVASDKMTAMHRILLK